MAGSIDQLAAAKDKCASCHQPGVDKAKVKGHGLNDFGQVVHKNLDDKAFMAAHKAKERAQALKLFSDAWAKSLEAKNADGQAYGELIDQPVAHRGCAAGDARRNT